MEKIEKEDLERTLRKSHEWPSTSPQIGKKQVGGCGNQDINRQEAE